MGIAFAALDELAGSKEHEHVLRLSDEIGGDLRAASIFRWPLGTSDARITSDLTMECDATLKVAFQAKLAMPYRYCWGKPSGTVDEQFVQELAPRLARCQEQAEMYWDQQLPYAFLVSIGQNQGLIEWGLSITVTPDRLIALTDDDFLFKTFDDVCANHEREYGTAPRAIAQVSFLNEFADGVNVRKIAGTMSKVIFNVNQWSRCYEDYGQMCYWLFD